MIPPSFFPLYLLYLHHPTSSFRSLNLKYSRPSGTYRYVRTKSTIISVLTLDFFTLGHDFRAFECVTLFLYLGLLSWPRDRRPLSESQIEIVHFLVPRHVLAPQPDRPFTACRALSWAELELGIAAARIEGCSFKVERVIPCYDQTRQATLSTFRQIKEVKASSNLLPFSSIHLSAQDGSQGSRCRPREHLAWTRGR